MKFDTGEKFLKIYLNNIKKLYKHLSSSEIKLFYLLTNYISYKTCELKNNNGTYLSAKQLSKFMNISIQMIYVTINKLIKKEIILKQKHGKKSIYIMNPFICFKGLYINKSVYELFKNTIWA
jgi:hypothetical protein